jgi:alpha-mannosidase
MIPTVTFSPSNSTSSMDAPRGGAPQTILRSPPYAYHSPPHEFGARRGYDWLDQGIQEFDLLLLPFTGGWQEAGIVQRGREFNIPLVKVTSHGHPGNLPGQASLGELTSPEMEMTALKLVEDSVLFTDDDGYILRLADRHGRGASGELRWGDTSFQVTLAPFDVRTLRLARRDGTWELDVTNMLEVSCEDQVFNN